MATSQNLRFPTLLRRELREYRTSLVWTPVVTAVLLALLMLLSVLLVNRISVLGDTILDALMADGRGSVEVSISVNDDGEEMRVIEIAADDEGLDLPVDSGGEIARIETDGQTQRIVLTPADPNAIPEPEDPPSPPQVEVVPKTEQEDERWNFSREWSFEPESRQKSDGDDSDLQVQEGRELNVMLSLIHSIFILILFLTTANYLLSGLFEDRKDRSILFWRSMPVSEWENIAAKIVTALLVAPIIFIFISVLLQIIYVVLIVVLVGRMDKDPGDVVLSNIDFSALFLDPLSGWVLTALWVAPAYAWFLLASSLARRSPLGLALLLPIGLFIVESVFLGTEFVGSAIGAHLPHLTDTSAVGFYVFGPQWMGVDLASMGAGLLFTALALTAAVWARRHRWEIN